MSTRLCIILSALTIILLPLVQLVSAQSTPGYGLATLQGMVTGFDLDGDRVPLSWVQINATSQSFNLTVYTGLNGLYVLILPPGTYKIVGALTGYQTQSTNITLASGQLMLHDFTLRSAFAVSPSPS